MTLRQHVPGVLEGTKEVSMGGVRVTVQEVEVGWTGTPDYVGLPKPLKALWLLV